MNTRIWSIVAAVTLLSFSSGCSSMKTLWFGRGARCGVCPANAATSPVYVPPQPVATTPYAPAAPYAPAVTVAPYQPPRCRLFGRQPKYQQPQCQQPVVVTPGCGCPSPCGNLHAGSVYSGGCGCGNYDSHASACGECAVASPCGGCSDYGCNSCSGVDPYGSVSDPYRSSGTVIDGSVMPYEGQIIDGQIIGDSGSIIGSSVLPGNATLQDNFDSRGDRIIHSDPLPPGAVLNP